MSLNIETTFFESYMICFEAYEERKKCVSIGDQLSRIRFNFVLCCDLVVLSSFSFAQGWLLCVLMWCSFSVDVNLVFDYALRVLICPFASNAKEGL